MEQLESQVSFESGGETLRGKLGLPSGLRPGERRAGFIIMHGFGGNMEDGLSRLGSRLLRELGYATLRFDYRGCGISAGARGLVLCEEEVEDALNAFSFLRRRPEVDPQRIGLLGGSLAGSIAILAAAQEKGVAACISCGGLASGESTLRWLHPPGDSWQRFASMVAQGRARCTRGEAVMVPRFDIIPIPPPMRSGLPAGAIMEFPFAVVESLLRLRPVDVVAAIASRPLLLLHPASDPVVSAHESIELFRHAGQPTDLHVLSSDDHFMLAEDNRLALDILKNWLRKYLPAEGGKK